MEEALVETPEVEKTDQEIIEEMKKEGWIASDKINSPLTHCNKCHAPVINRSVGVFGRKQVEVGNPLVVDTLVHERKKTIATNYGGVQTDQMTFHKLLSYPQPGDVFHPEVCTHGKR